ncbi:MAG: Glycogen debranching enzyme family protein [Microgenomates group bacterium GW2011_GWC1_39_7]|nr:MAG: Glycogen debranching enzyme family protein [Microgenomates group bacterium GW2011_GWC1_39_7]
MNAVEADLLDKIGNSRVHPISPDRPGRYVAFEGNEQDPHPVYLPQGEVIVSMSPVEIRWPAPISPIEALMLVTKAQKVEDIGLHPVSAAACTPENAEKPELQLFSDTEFGRDEIIVAQDLIKDFPKVAKTALISLAESQGVDFDYAREERRGSIIHEKRSPEDPLAQKITSESGWGWAYYGAKDSNPLYIQLAGLYVQQKGREILSEVYKDKNGEEQEVLHAVTLAADLMIKEIDASPLGMLEFRQEIPKGISNQVWRDSKEAYHHADGRIADNTYGIASFSLQVDAYKALQALSSLFPENKHLYDGRAKNLKDRILNDFWVEDERGGYFALGAEKKEDGAYELLRIRTSDMGHVLDSDILEGDDPGIVRKREMLIRALFSPEMFSGKGIRTLASSEVRYNPASYHNGSVWIRENNKIAKGLERHGNIDLAALVHQCTVNIWLSLGIMPENVPSDDTPEPRINGRIVDAEGQIKYRVEQPGQLIQAWSGGISKH